MAWFSDTEEGVAMGAEMMHILYAVNAKCACTESSEDTEQQAADNTSTPCCSTIDHLNSSKTVIVAVIALHDHWDVRLSVD